ncbi:MAG: hypothetical protein AAB738_00155 [Patescibacteria group bacterium]
MTQETRSCQSCKQNFVIEPEDFAFYEKVQVPPPTFCPDCRLQRRMTWRNERTLYHAKCAATGKDMISMFDPENPRVVYDRDYWWSDNWDQFVAGRDYDFSKPFFVQFRELLEKAPLPNLANSNVINSDYGNHNADLKNGYLVFASFGNENISYASGAVDCKDSLDMYTAEKTEQSYEITFSVGLNKCSFCYDVDNSLDSSFLRACNNLNNCLGCVSLKNKSYHIFNQPYSKEDFRKEVEKIDFGSYKNLEAFKQKYKEFIKDYPRRYATLVKSVNTTGDMIMNAKNCKQCFDIYDTIEDCKYAIHATKMRDTYDSYGAGLTELLYEGVDTGIDSSDCQFVIYAHKCRNVEYVYACQGTDHLFGCIGLRSKKYCILNKQYTKEEYETLVPKIKKRMDEMPYIDKKGRVYKYGEFFPAELSPFAYNETIAQEYFPLNKISASEKGFDWKELREKNYHPTLKASELPDHIKDVTENITKEVISCAHADPSTGGCEEQCTGAYKITAQELQFYKKFNYPLPRLCSNCRHYQRLKQRNPFHLWHRKCQCAGTHSENGKYQNVIEHPHGNTHCESEFETPYSPDRLETIYCGQCYQTETQ